MAPTVKTVEKQLTRVAAVDFHTNTNSTDNDAVSDVTVASGVNALRRRASIVRTTIIVSPELDQNRHRTISLLHNSHHHHHHNHLNNITDDNNDADSAIYNDFGNSLRQYRSQLAPTQQSAFDDAWSRLYADANNTNNYEVVSEPLLKEMKCVSEVFCYSTILLFLLPL